MNTRRNVVIGVAVAALVGVAAFVMVFLKTSSQTQRAPRGSQPSLTVAVTTLQEESFPIRLAAHGDIVAWQEASVGMEANGLRLIDVRVNVGDKVRRGQLLALLAAEVVEADLAQVNAAVAEAEAALAEAADNAQRSHVLQESGALSAQQIQRYVTAEQAAMARLDAARAVARAQQMRLLQTRIVAPDDGIISARTATVGAVVPAGQELFRLVRRGRLEWRAEVAAAELARLKPGLHARVTPDGGAVIEGRLRTLAPVVDVQTRNGLVYVDLPASGTARAGMFARGEFELGTASVKTLPQSAVQMRDGFSYVLRVNDDSRVVQTRVNAGRRHGERVEIISGLDVQTRVVMAGTAFLGDGDLVRVVDEKALP